MTLIVCCWLDFSGLLGVDCDFCLGMNFWFMVWLLWLLCFALILVGLQVGFSLWFVWIVFVSVGDIV